MIKLNVFRVLRKRKIKLSFVILFLLIFIANTYAWFSFAKTSRMKGLIAEVRTWSVDYEINDEHVEDEVLLEVEDFYPGMQPVEKKINIYNTKEDSSQLKFEITQIILYGQEIFNCDTVGEEKTDEETQITTCNLFENEEATIFDENNENYSFSLRYPTPFLINYEYDKPVIEGSRNDISGKAVFTMNFIWDNDEKNNVEDTKLGNLVYDYYMQDNETVEAPLKIKVKITAERLAE